MRSGDFADKKRLLRLRERERVRGNLCVLFWLNGPFECVLRERGDRLARRALAERNEDAQPLCDVRFRVRNETERFGVFEEHELIGFGTRDVTDVVEVDVPFGLSKVRGVVTLEIRQLLR